tara:strand:- start:1249 stop:2058 length:810 start_codon:yes stop_codon:yes gene_type:complete
MALEKYSTTIEDQPLKVFSGDPDSLQKLERAFLPPGTEIVEAPGYPATRFNPDWNPSSPNYSYFTTSNDSTILVVHDDAEYGQSVSRAGFFWANWNAPVENKPFDMDSIPSRELPQEIAQLLRKELTIKCGVYSSHEVVDGRIIEHANYDHRPPQGLEVLCHNTAKFAVQDGSRVVVDKGEYKQTYSWNKTDIRYLCPNHFEQFNLENPAPTDSTFTDVNANEYPAILFDGGHYHDEIIPTKIHVVGSFDNITLLLGPIPKWKLEPKQK